MLSIDRHHENFWTSEETNVEYSKATLNLLTPWELASWSWLQTLQVWDVKLGPGHELINNICFYRKVNDQIPTTKAIIMKLLLIKSFQ